MNPFFWNTMILMCNFGIIDNNRVDNDCVSYMMDCVMSPEQQTNAKYIRCQNQWLQIQRSYTGSKKCKGGSLDKSLLRKDGYVNGQSD